MAQAERGTHDLVVFADDWGRQPSSCQHLIEHLRDDYRALWVNTIGTRRLAADCFTVRRVLEKLRRWARGLQPVGGRMCTIDLPMLPGLSGHSLTVNRLLTTWVLRRVYARLGMSAPILLTNLPFVGWLTRDLPRRALVYYCTDDYSCWPSADRTTLVRADAELTREADLVLAASRALADLHASSAACRYFPHGVDFEHFAAVPQLEGPLPPELDGLAAPRVGYFGLVYEKLDFTLLAEVARKFPRGSVVLVGRVAYCPAWFAKLPNVHLLGHRPYEALPRYLRGLDVLLLPYVKDEFISKSSPLKLRECLASGKPTVSIDLPECRLFEPHLRIAGTAEGFVEHVGQALAEPAAGPLSRSRQAAVAQQSWEKRADQLRGYLAEVAAPASRSVGCLGE